MGLERQRLLPRWIRALSWTSLIGSSATLLGAIGAAPAGLPINVSLLGIQYAGTVWSLQAILLLLALLANGATAYGLLWGRRWGVLAGLMTGCGDVALCVASVVVQGPGGFRLPFEPFLLVPFMVALWRRRAVWRESAGA
jgi:hypothetical protein